MSQADTDLRFPARRMDGDTLEDRLSHNAYHNILPARYLKNDQQGNVIEEQEELFPRVAKNMAVAEAVHVDEDVWITHDHIKPDHPSRDDLIEKVFDDREAIHPGGGMFDDSIDRVLLTEDNAKWVSYDVLIQTVSSDVAVTLQEWKENFHSLMTNLEWVPNSPTLMNAGNQFQQLSACFVNTPGDDMGDIYQTLRESALVMQSGGGMGYAFSYLRPYGDVVGSSGGIASGPITFMRSYDQMCATISQGGTRRGAQMGVMRCTHPDLPFFIHAKNKDVSLAQTLLLNDPDDPTHTSFSEALEEAREVIDDNHKLPNYLRNAVEGHLSNFNISVTVTEEFMEAAFNGDDFTMINPRTGEPHIATEHTKELYDMFDMGEHVEVGKPLEVPASEFVEDMVDGMYENGEPGILFIDEANQDHSFDVDSTPTTETNQKHEMHSTNPCGEQWLEEYEACNLGHINLSTIIEHDRIMWEDFFEGEYGNNGVELDDIGDDELELAIQDFLMQAVDFDELDKRIRHGTRFLDNVVTMSNFEFGEDFEFDDIEQKVGNNRKIGLGIMGLAHMYVQLGVKYGDRVANEIGRQMMTYINQQAKQYSHELAQERGSFNNWDESKYSDPTEYREWFERQVGLDADGFYDGYEIRNHNVTTVAPTGTTGMLGDTSRGCEPIYQVAFFKNVSDDVQGEDMLVEWDDYFLDVLKANDIDTEEVKAEAKEQMENNEFGGIETLSTVPNELLELFVTTNELSGEQHASVQCELQKGVDSALSKTVNFPNTATHDDIWNVLQYLHENDAKGATIYRDGSRNKQVITTRRDNKIEEDEIDEEEAAEKIVELSEQFDIDLDDVLDTEADSMVASGSVEPRDRPKVLDDTHAERISTGYGTLYVNVNYDEDGEPLELFADLGKSGGFTQSWVDSMARMISLALRSGVAPEYIIDQLSGTRSPKMGIDEGERIHSIPDGIATVLEHSVQDDTEAVEIEDAELAKTNGAAKSNGSDAETIVDEGESPECPECDAMLTYQEGCKSCEFCGWSEC